MWIVNIEDDETRAAALAAYADVSVTKRRATMKYEQAIIAARSERNQAIEIAVKRLDEMRRSLAPAVVRKAARRHA